MKQRIILSGMGGQGVISLGNLIGISSMLEDKSVSIVPSYGAEMRGGISNCFVTISDKRINTPIFSAADVGIFMYQPAMDIFRNNVVKNGLIIYDKNIITQRIKKNDVEFKGVPANLEAEKIGNIKAANMILAGVWCRMKKIVKFDSGIKAIREMFKNKNKEVIKINEKAFEFGYKFIK